MPLLEQKTRLPAYGETMISFQGRAEELLRLNGCPDRMISAGWQTWIDNARALNNLERDLRGENYEQFGLFVTHTDSLTHQIQAAWWPIPGLNTFSAKGRRDREALFDDHNGGFALHWFDRQNSSTRACIRRGYHAAVCLVTSDGVVIAQTKQYPGKPITADIIGGGPDMDMPLAHGLVAQLEAIQELCLVGNDGYIHIPKISETISDIDLMRMFAARMASLDRAGALRDSPVPWHLPVKIIEAHEKFRGMDRIVMHDEVGQVVDCGDDAMLCINGVGYDAVHIRQLPQPASAYSQFIDVEYLDGDEHPSYRQGDVLCVPFNELVRSGDLCMYHYVSSDGQKRTAELPANKCLGSFIKRARLLGLQL